MAGKFDKEIIKKHHFWFLFAPVALFTLISWFALFAEVPDDITKTEDANKSERTKHAGVKGQPRKALDEFGKQLSTLETRKIDMWREAWNGQKEIYTWPEGFTDKQREVVRHLKFGEEIQDEQFRNQFRGRNVYEKEYTKLVEQMEPMKFKDGWEKVVRYVASWGRVPSSEDVWLAMEDFWVQRELLVAIDRVNKNAAMFHPVTKRVDGTEVPKDPKRRVFHNRFWELELRLIEDKGERYLKASLRNISDRLQVMGVGNKMTLLVWLTPDAKRPFEFEVEGTSVEAWRGHYKFTSDSLDGLKSEGVPAPVLNKFTAWLQANKKKDVKDEREFDTKQAFMDEMGRVIDKAELDQWQVLIARYSEVGRLPIKTIKAHYIPVDVKATELNRVEQQFDVRTVPIKRIEAIGLGQLSDRNNNLPLKMSTFSEAMAKREAGSVPVATPPAGTVGAETTPTAPALPAVSQNELVRPRYIDVTEQIRRMPVGIVLVTDQSFMKDILEAIMNIKMRFQMTQTDLTRFHGTMDYGPAATPKAAAPPVFNPLGVGSSPTNNREDQFSANLMELSIYGIVSLYERFPDDGKTKQPKK